jgi:hypothetical protein
MGEKKRGFGGANGFFVRKAREQRWRGGVVKAFLIGKACRSSKGVVVSEKLLIRKAWMSSKDLEVSKRPSANTISHVGCHVGCHIGYQIGCKWHLCVLLVLSGRDGMPLAMVHSFPGQKLHLEDARKEGRQVETVYDLLDD